MERSGVALIANESEAIVFKEREWSLDFLLRFALRQNEGGKLPHKHLRMRIIDLVI